MLDPSRYALNAETVGFRKRMKLAVPMDSFKKALQTQSESIKVRREIQETPITEVHIMGGQMYGFQGNDKLITLERQQRQINGYPLRSFRVNSGPIFLPAKFGEGYQATPTMMGRVAYTSNATEGNYISKMTEPDPDHISTWNPVQKRKMLMGLEQKYSEMQKNVADWQEKRGFVNQITKQDNFQRQANQIRANQRDPEKTQSLEMALTAQDINRLGRDQRFMDVAGERMRRMTNNMDIRNTTTFTNNVQNNQQNYQQIQVTIGDDAIARQIARRARKNRRRERGMERISFNKLESAEVYLKNAGSGTMKVIQTERVREAIIMLSHNQDQYDLEAIENEIQEFLAVTQEKHPNVEIVTNAIPAQNDVSVNMPQDLADDYKRNASANSGDPMRASKEGGAVNVGPEVAEDQLTLDELPNAQLPSESVFVDPTSAYGDTSELQVTAVSDSERLQVVRTLAKMDAIIKELYADLEQLENDKDFLVDQSAETKKGRKWQQNYVSITLKISEKTAQLTSKLNAYEDIERENNLQ